MLEGDDPEAVGKATLEYPARRAPARLRRCQVRAVQGTAERAGLATQAAGNGRAALTLTFYPKRCKLA
jgi:hypothetical protein